MPAAKLALTIEQGATFRHQLQLKQGTSVSGPAVDLTGYTAVLLAKLKYGERPVVLELTTENGGITITPETGVMDLFISAVDTAALSFPNTVEYLLKIIAPGGDVTPVVGGAMSLKEDL